MKKLRFWAKIVADDQIFLLKISFLVLLGNAVTQSEYYEYFFLLSLILQKNIIFNTLSDAKLMWFSTPLDPRVIFLSKNVIVLLNSLALTFFLIIATPLPLIVCLKYLLNLGTCLIFGNFISNYWANTHREWQTNVLIIISYGLSSFFIYLCNIYLTGTNLFLAFFVLTSGLAYSILKQTSFVNKYFLIGKLLRNDKN
jgi:hypothetical protein